MQLHFIHYLLYKIVLIAVLTINTAAANKPPEKTLTIYTYDSFISQWGPGNKLKTLFEKECQCQLRFISAADGVSILNRLRIEQDNTKADIILGIDNLIMQQTLQTKLIASHELKLDTLSPSFNWNNEYFIPFDYGYFSFIYDSEKVSAPASSLTQLLNQDNSIIYQDPRTSTVGQGLLLWMNQVFKENTNAAWEKLSERTITVTKGWSEAYSIFLDGGADYVLSYHTSPAYHIENDQTTRYRAASFSEGHIRQIEVAALISTSDNQELGRRFLTFLLSTEAQQIIASHNWMQPVIDNVDLPTGFSDLIQPKNLHWSLEQFNQKRQDWINEWRNIASKRR